MKPPTLHILYEDNHLLAVVKPAGLPTMGTPGGQPTLLSVAKDYIAERYHKPGNVYLGVMSRLDAPVTGVVVLARTSKAASRLTEQFRSHSVEKRYWAVVEGVVESAAGSLVDWLGQDDRHRRMHIVGPTLAGAREARLSFRRLATIPHQRKADVFAGRETREPTAGPDNSLLEVTLETGRKHQIRLQLAHHGHPIVGDRKYGSRLKFPDGIALHARRATGAAARRLAPLRRAGKGVRS
jgi:23S rRNA pseudouridine1911/1915/1917 synthase